MSADPSMRWTKSTVALLPSGISIPCPDAEFTDGEDLLVVRSISFAGYDPCRSRPNLLGRRQ